MKPSCVRARLLSSGRHRWQRLYAPRCGMTVSLVVVLLCWLVVDGVHVAAHRGRRNVPAVPVCSKFLLKPGSDAVAVALNGRRVNC